MNMRDDLTLHLDTKTSTDHFYYCSTLHSNSKRSSAMNIINALKCCCSFLKHE